jgi:CDP-diacylglycerol--glycerol-3-phosphate 3-phosphatidyltransferase
MNKKKIVRNITISRIFFSVMMVFFSIYSLKYLFLFFYSLAVISDKVDGVLARHFKVVSREGARLDAIADEIMLIFLISSIYFIKPEIIFNHIWFFIYIVFLYISTRIIVYLKQGKIDKVPMSLYLSKFNLAFINLGTLFVFIFNKFNLVKYGLYFLTITISLCRIEEVLIHLKYKKVPHDIKTILDKKIF